MWLFTDTGFVSAVSNGTDLMVRSRDRESLEPLAEVAKVEIKKTPQNDYPYRVVINHEIFADWVALMARNIRYKNYKSEVAATRGYEFAHPLIKVWSVMHEVEDGEARNISWPQGLENKQLMEEGNFDPQEVGKSQVAYDLILDAFELALLRSTKH